MINATVCPPQPARGARKSALVVAILALAAIAGAHAATADSPTSRSTGIDAKKSAASGRQVWQISDYSTLQLVARESGGPANQQPWQVEPEALRAMLATAQLETKGGVYKPLFAADELSALVPSLVEALGQAQPDQDIAVVSTARHGDNTFLALSAVTARMFVADGQLNLIVRDGRFDFYDTARGTGVAPHFTVGSRTRPGSAHLRGATAANVRADWLTMSTTPVPAPTAAPAPAPAPAANPPAATPPVARPAAPSLPPVGGDAEQRLKTLKRLFDQGLITAEEYQRKRQEIIQSL